MHVRAKPLLRWREMKLDCRQGLDELIVESAGDAPTLLVLGRHEFPREVGQFLLPRLEFAVLLSVDCRKGPHRERDHNVDPNGSC